MVATISCLARLAVHLAVQPASLLARNKASRLFPGTTRGKAPERSHSQSQFHSLNPKSLLTTACSQRYMWRGGNTQMDRGEKEKERERGR